MASELTSPRQLRPEVRSEVPPHSLEAERAVLGGLLLQPSAIDAVSELIKPDDLYSGGHERIYSTMLDLHWSGIPVDHVTVRDRLDSAGRLGAVGGDDYLLSLTDTIPTLENTRAHARIIQEHARSRGVLALGRRLAKAGQDGDLREAQSAVTEASRVLDEAKPSQFADAWKSLGELGALTNAPPPRRHLLTRPDDETNGMTAPIGVLPQGKVGVLVGAGGGGKSWAVIELSLSVATGRKWLDYFDVSRPGPVLLALGEEDAEEASRRFFTCAQAMRLTEDQVARASRDVVLLPLAGVAAQLVETDGRTTVETAALQELRKRLGGREWRLVILDPLSRFAGADTEKDNAAATRFIQAVESLTKVPGGPTVLVPHHTNKLARAEGAKAAASNARGASAITDGARWVAELESLGDDGARLTFTKSNYGRLGAPVDLVRDAAHGGYLRVASVDELRGRMARAEDAKATRDRERIATLAERILAELARQPGQSKDTLRLNTGARRGDVIAAVDLLLGAGRVTPAGRYGYELATVGGHHG